MTDLEFLISAAYMQYMAMMSNTHNPNAQRAFLASVSNYTREYGSPDKLKEKEIDALCHKAYVAWRYVDN